MSKIQVALAQIQPFSAPEHTSLDDDIAAGVPFPTLKANLEQIERHVKEAKDAGADIVIFPEYLQGILNEDRQVSWKSHSSRLFILITYLSTSRSLRLTTKRSLHPSRRSTKLEFPAR
jgi:Leu/Phe-tRNA-protein transferase